MNFTIIGRGAAVLLEGILRATIMSFPTSKSSFSLITLSLSSLSRPADSVTPNKLIFVRLEYHEYCSNSTIRDSCMDISLLK